MSPAPGDPYQRAQSPLGDRIARAVWGVACMLLFRPTPAPLHAWRALVLRCFGARLGKGCHIYSDARIWAPWNLVCEDSVAIANGAVVYNAAPVRLGSHAIVSQQAYLCTATHDPDDPEFPLLSRTIVVGAYAWVCARAIVLPGVTLHEGAVLGTGAIATADLEPWSIYVGNPARRMRQRTRNGHGNRHGKQAIRAVPGSTFNPPSL